MTPGQFFGVLTVLNRQQLAGTEVEDRAGLGSARAAGAAGASLIRAPCLPDEILKLPSIHFSQRELAEMLRLSREWVSRELARRRDAGIVERTLLVVHDKGALQPRRAQDSIRHRYRERRSVTTPTVFLAVVRRTPHCAVPRSVTFLLSLQEEDMNRLTLIIAASLVSWVIQGTGGNAQQQNCGPLTYSNADQRYTSVPCEPPAPRVQTGVPCGIASYSNADQRYVSMPCPHHGAPTDPSAPGVTP